MMTSVKGISRKRKLSIVVEEETLLTHVERDIFVGSTCSELDSKRYFHCDGKVLEQKLN
jgi:hypothetical protein